MFLSLLAALLAIQINPGLPPPWPDDRPFDVSSICVVVMTDEADRQQGEGKDTRFLDAAAGFFAAQITQVRAGSEQTAIDLALKKVAGQPQCFRDNCDDAFAVGYARLGRPRPGQTSTP